MHKTHRVALPKTIAVLEKVSKVRPHISRTGWGRSKVSANLDMGRRPELKTEELLDLPLLVVEIISILCLKPLKMCYIVWEHDPIKYMYKTCIIDVSCTNRRRIRPAKPWRAF